jgi:hypothetical protein
MTSAWGDFVMVLVNQCDMMGAYFVPKQRELMV